MTQNGEIEAHFLFQTGAFSTKNGEIEANFLFETGAFSTKTGVDAAETDSFQRSPTVTHAFFKRATLDAYMRFLPPTPLSNVHFKKDDLFQEKRSTMFYHDTDFTTT